MPLKISLPENETAVNLKSASFVVIMDLHQGLTHIQSQIKPRLLFDESFTLNAERLTFTFVFVSDFHCCIRRWGWWWRKGV